MAEFGLDGEIVKGHWADLVFDYYTCGRSEF
jgi:hypothetical protein